MRLFILSEVILGVAAFSSTASKVLNVAMIDSLPPYVIKDASGNYIGGTMFDLVETLFEDDTHTYSQMPWGNLQAAIQDDASVDISVGTLSSALDAPDADGVHYSEPFLWFKNWAHTQNADDITLNSVADLAGHPVKAYLGANLQLGDVFNAMYGPGGSNFDEYEEFASQEDQMRAFWTTPNAVAVADGEVFKAETLVVGYSPTESASYPVFGDATVFQVSFRNSENRDDMSDRLRALCESGSFKQDYAGKPGASILDCPGSDPEPEKMPCEVGLTPDCDTCQGDMYGTGMGQTLYSGQDCPQMIAADAGGCYGSYKGWYGQFCCTTCPPDP